MDHRKAAEEKIAGFLKRHTLAVIATSHIDGSPAAALIDVSVRDNLEIVFDTFSDTRKYRNLLKRDRVALVIGWDENTTVQYEGHATEVPASDVARYQKDHIEKVPEERPFIEAGAIVFKANPRWIRYSDFTKNPPEILELTF